MIPEPTRPRGPRTYLRCAGNRIPMHSNTSARTTITARSSCSEARKRSTIPVSLFRRVIAMYGGGMRVKVERLFFLVAIAVTLTMPSVAQEGHPLTGTWYGDFGRTANQRHDLTVVMSWDGKQTSGTVNPGPGAVPLKVARLDVTLGNPGRQAVAAQGNTPAQPAVRATPPTFMVHFEVDAKNKVGGMDHFVFDGKLLNPVAGNRTITGTWTCGNTKGDFHLHRN